MMRVWFLLVLACACSFLHAQVSIITTFAGRGTAGFSGDGSTFDSAVFNRPNSIWFDLEGNTYITDAFNGRVRVISVDNEIVNTLAGNGGAGYSGDGIAATDAELYIPQGICTDFFGNIFISDVGNNRIRKVDRLSRLIATVAGNGIAGGGGDGGAATSGQLSWPAGVFVFENFIYVADYGNEKVRRVDLTDGTIVTFAGTGSSGYSGDGSAATNAQFHGVIDVFVSPSGDVLVSDQWNGVVRKIDISSGIITTVAGKGTLGYSGDGGPATDAQLNEPTGLFVDKDNNLYISDYRNGAIRKVDGATGIITTVAGGAAGYGGDGGPATNAKLKCTDVAVRENGDIYIADYVNHRIRKVSSGVAVNGIDKEVEGKLYPNPTQGVFTVQTPISLSLVTVYNAAGLRVYERTCTTQQAEVDISTQPPGVYMVYVLCGDKTYASKVLRL